VAFKEAGMKSRLALTLALSFAATTAAGAADLGYAAPPPEAPAVVAVPGGWEVVIAPYLWAAGLSGDVGVGGRTAQIDQSFGDILSDFDIGFMGVTEVRYDRFGIFSDVAYAKLSATDKTPFQVLANKIHTESTSLMWTLAAEYRIVQQPGASLDVMAGFRLFSLKNSLEFKGGPLGGLDASDTETWADPIVGIKGSIDLTARLYLTGWAMGGGFGVSSDSVWDVMAGLGYRFNDRLSMALGYRAAGVDYEKDGFTYDTVQQGPFSGIVYKF
jgi:hypothetical protein